MVYNLIGSLVLDDFDIGLLSAAKMTTTFNVEDVIFSILIGAIPTCSMLLASFALMNLKVQPLIEACFQNFCAGLILAAVAMELFPLMAPSDIISPFCSAVGTSFGFILGIAMINGVDQIIDSFENDQHAHGDTVDIPKCDVSCKGYIQKTQNKCNNCDTGEMNSVLNATNKWELSPSGGRHTPSVKPWMSTSASNSAKPSMEMTVNTSKNSNQESSKILNGTAKPSYSQPYSLVSSTKEEIDVDKFDLDRAGCAEDGYDHEAILYAAIAIATPSHRAHIKEHFLEIMNAIFVLESNAVSLMSGQCSREVGQSEKLAEEIDEEIHMLQYRLDHTRRCTLSPCYYLSPT